jgi:hypothetical protein
LRLRDSGTQGMLDRLVWKVSLIDWEFGVQGKQEGVVEAMFYTAGIWKGECSCWLRRCTLMIRYVVRQVFIVGQVFRTHQFRGSWRL